MPILTLLIALPFVGAAVVALLPSRRPETVFPVSLGVSMAPLAVGVYLLAEYSADEAVFQFFENYVISERFGIAWELAIDGISLFMVALTVLLFPIAIAASRSVTDRVKTYMVLMLILEGAVLGVFLALDLIVFFAFFEIVLIPMYLLISMWGSERRAYAALKFVLFTAMSGVTAAARCTIGTIRDTPELAALYRAAMDETERLARALGVALPEGTADAHWERTGGLPADMRASTAIDLERGAALETPWINGAVVRLARAAGIDVPANAALSAVLAPWVDGQR